MTDTASYPATTKETARFRFRELLDQAAVLIREAAATAAIDPIRKAQAEAAAGLASLRLSTIYGEPEAEDFLNYHDHCLDIANAIDPLIEAIGNEAASASREIDRDLFERPLYSALDGNALFSLTQAAEQADAALMAAE